MFLRMVYDDSLAAAAYVIGCQRSGDAIVIDPQRDVDRYERIAAENGLRITAVAETHIHADFVSGARELAEKGAVVYVSGEGDDDSTSRWLDARSDGGSYAHRLLRDGDTFAVGNVEFAVVHTPGHTPEHISFMVTDRGGGADRPMGVMTGDFVFVGDVGRPDLLETAAGRVGDAEPAAHRLYRAVRAFTQWPDYLQVWPAHGAGSACGKALGAVPSSTVGYEKMFNPSIRAAESEQGFVDFILQGQPEPPLYFANMKRDNAVGPPLLGGVPQPSRLAAAELVAADPKSIALVDTRPWPQFREAHLPGALHLPLNGAFSTDAGSMIDQAETMYLIVEASRVDDAVRRLIRVGLDHVVGWYDADAWDECVTVGGASVGTAEVDVDGAHAMIAQSAPFVLDVRRKSEFDEGFIPGATNIAHTRLLSRLDELPADREILVN